LQAKGEGSVKTNTEELGGGVECNGGPSQSEIDSKFDGGTVLKKQHSHLAGLTGMRHFKNQRHFNAPFQVGRRSSRQLRKLSASLERKNRWRDLQHRVNVWSPEGRS